MSGIHTGFASFGRSRRDRTVLPESIHLNLKAQYLRAPDRPGVSPSVGPLLLVVHLTGCAQIPCAPAPLPEPLERCAPRRDMRKAPASSELVSGTSSKS